VATDLEQLIDAVERQPGARAYALLAERYLGEGNVDGALEVCDRGFTVNPAYERGAVAYLSALQMTGDAKRAGEVYGRAVAEHPRSSQLRVAWARVLLDAGREYEARLRTREAVNLDPMNRDARALLATLGGTPPPSLRTTGGIEIIRPDATAEYVNPPVEGTSPFVDIDEAAAVEPEEGGTREYVNPPADHPPLVMPLKRRGADANFDFTPAPVLRSSEPSAPPIDTLADFFDVPEAPPPQTPKPVLVPSRPAVASGPPPTPPPPPAPPPTPVSPPAPATIAPRGAPRHDFTGPQHPPELRSQDLFPQVASPDEASTSGAPLVEPRTPGRPAAPSTAEVPQLSGVTPQAPPKKRRMWPWALLTLVIVGGGGTAGVLVYRHLQRKQVEATMQTDLARLRTGAPAATNAARGALCRAAEANRGVARLAAACALASAELVHNGNRELATRAGQDLARARKRDPRDSWTATALTLLALTQGKLETAVKAAATLPEGSSDWLVTLTRARVLEREGKPAAAAKALAPLTLAEKAPLPVLVAAARLERLGGRSALASKLIAKALALAPEHVGAALQQALLDIARDKPPAQARTTTLASKAKASAISRWQADATLLQAAQLARSKRFAAASAMALAASKQIGDERPELGWWAGRWLLTPGGKATEAARLLTRWGPAYEAHAPAAVLMRARALLALSRPHAADALLQKADAKALSARANVLAVAKVRVAEALDDRRRLQDLCPPTLAEPTRMVACAEALLSGGERRHIRRWRRRSPRRGPVARYLAGLLSLARGDARRSVRRLSKAKAAPIEESRRLAALGRAYVLAGQFAKALKVLRQAITASAGAVRPRVELARALVAAGHDTEALEVLGGVVVAKPSDARLLAVAGRTYVALGRPKQARELIDRAAKVRPEATSLHLLGGEVALLEGQLDKAQALFRKVLAKQPRRVEALVALGRIAAQRKQSRRAKRHFAAALRRRPKDPDVRQQLAMAYLHLRRWRDAYAQTQQAVKLLQKRGQRRRAVELRIVVGRALRRGDRRARKKAQELLFEASTSANPPPSAFYELGRLHRVEGDRARAIWCFKQAIKRDKAMADAYLQLGLAQRGKRRWRRKSRRNLQRYLKLAPKGKHAARVRKLLGK
jgi:tetratricopeptide (TPR) repeat protein